jgi:DNA topoisomerase-6 subunit B
MRKAVSALIEVDIKNNKGVIKNRETFDWDRPHGTRVEFMFDGRIQINGEAGLLNYLLGTTLVNPHLNLEYKLPDQEWARVERVTKEMPMIPEATEPHPHTMKLGEFIAHSHLFGRQKVSVWLKKGFSRIGDSVIDEMVKKKDFGLQKSMMDKLVDQVPDGELNKLFSAIQNTELKAPSTNSVLSIGEDALAKSIQRLGKVDYFSVVTRKPTICDFKPVQVEVAIARLETKSIEADSPIQLLRFANRVPLQFDKSACAIAQSITSVNWRSYGLAQPKDSFPTGPYIFAVSVVSPFIKFKNASKETIDASDELVEEIRRTLMQAGQKLSRYIRAEHKANELEEKIRYIEQFGPILVEGLARITDAKEDQKKRARDGLMKILGRDATATEKELTDANKKLEIQKAKDAEDAV